MLFFSLLPLLCLACISLPLIYKNQVGKIQEEVYEELQNRADDMNYEMNTIELMAKTVWSDTTFITEVERPLLTVVWENITVIFFRNRLCRLLG